MFTTKNIPQNAWLLDARRDGKHRAIGGERVEFSDDFISEGAWVGDFSADGALGSPFRSGSGVVIEGSVLHVFAPTHSVEAVYAYLAPDFGPATSPASAWRPSPTPRCRDAASRVS